MSPSQVAGPVSHTRVCVNAHVWRSINSSGDRPLMLSLLLNPKAEGGQRGEAEGRREGKDQDEVKYENLNFSVKKFLK